MRKVILFQIAAMIAASIISQAETVDVNFAKRVATNFYKSNSDKKITSITIAFTETARDGSAAYYVFNINRNDGFVIVTADDAAKPIIGYATTGHYNANNVIPPVVMWLERRKEEISYIKSKKLKATQEIKNKWQACETLQDKRVGSIMGGGVAPLCATIWNQYDSNCPRDAVAGCVATAMAQIMKYWHYPPKGIGSVTYDNTASLGFTGNYGIISANFAETNYDWSDMPDSTTNSGRIYTYVSMCS